MWKQNTLAAFSDFSFLTTSPCCATRSYRPGGQEEEEEEEEEEQEEAAVAAVGAEDAGLEGAIPGL